MRLIGEFLKDCWPLLCFILGLMLSAFSLISLHSRYQCDNYEKMTGKETRFVAFDACYVKTADGFERWDAYKARAMTNEAQGE